MSYAASSNPIKSYGDNLKKGNYQLHSRFNKAVNFISDETMVSIVTEEVGSGPLNIVINGMELTTINYLTIGDGSLTFNDFKFTLNTSKRYHSKIDNTDIDGARFIHNVDIFTKHLLVNSPPKSLAFLADERRKENFKTSFEKELIRNIELGVASIFSSNYIEGINKIKGRGFGFTPSGDDFISGFLIALNMVQQVFRRDLTSLIDGIYETAKSKNPLSNNFLLCAKQGFLFEKFKKLVHSLSYLDEAEILKNTQNLCSVGETSGADMGVGFIVGLKSQPLLKH